MRRCEAFFGSYIIISSLYIFYYVIEIMTTWNEKTGVWMGQTPSAAGDETLPNPLYIFGYGSLLWRPGNLMGQFPSYAVSVYNYRRVFAQRSCDHRGTPSFAGIVVTLLAEEFFKDAEQAEEEECVGRVWLVPQEQASDLIAELDFREKGGYVRCKIQVCLKELSPHHDTGVAFPAIVYTATPSNPNFFFKHPREWREVQQESGQFRNSKTITNNNISGGGLLNNFYAHGLISIESINIISAAHGPSGANGQYLFRLAWFLKRHGIADKTLESLALNVVLRMGPWTPGLFSSSLSSSSSRAAASAFGSEDKNSNSRSRLLGWGSNEYNQLHTGVPESIFAATLALPTRISADADNPPPPSSSPSSQPLPRWLFSGGGSSGCLEGDGRLLLWGKKYRIPDWLRGFQRPEDLQAYEAETATTVCVHGVAGASLGYGHCLVLLRCGWVLALGDDACGQCSQGPPGFCLPGIGTLLASFTSFSYSPPHPPPPPEGRCIHLLVPVPSSAPTACTVRKVCVGVLHSTAIVSVRQQLFAARSNSNSSSSSSSGGGRGEPLPLPLPLPLSIVDASGSIRANDGGVDGVGKLDQNGEEDENGEEIDHKRNTVEEAAAAAVALEEVDKVEMEVERGGDALVTWGDDRLGQTLRPESDEYSPSIQLGGGEEGEGEDGTTSSSGECDSGGNGEWEAFSMRLRGGRGGKPLFGLWRAMGDVEGSETDSVSSGRVQGTRSPIRLTDVFCGLRHTGVIGQS